MPKSIRPFKWDDANKETVLNFVFEGRISQAKMSEIVGVTTRTIERWIAHPGFQARLEEKRANLEKALTGVIYADKARRIVALSAMAESARIAYEEHVMLIESRPIPKCDEPMTSESFNRDAFESFRGALDDIAKELGHRQSKTEHSGSVDLNERVTFYVPTPEVPPDNAE